MVPKFKESFTHSTEVSAESRQLERILPSFSCALFRKEFESKG